MKKVLLFVFIGLLLLAIPATIFYLGQQRDIRTRAAPATTLSLTPAIQTVDVGDTFTVNVTMTPAANQVVSADIYITYDQTKMTATAITNGANAPRILNSGVIQNGTASIRVGAASNAQPIATTGPIAVVTFTATGPTTAISPANIQFASNTFVGGLDEVAANVLVGTTGAKITINGIGNTVTPNLTPTATPSATLTPTLILTVTPTIPATQSGEATASALAILSPTSNDSSVSAQPIIRGKAPAGSTVTVVIHSSSAQTAVVTADAMGNWTYTPTTPLETGPHDITVSIQNESGVTQTASDSFIVAGAGSGGTTETSVMPVSGNIETTIVLIAAGIVLFLSGAVLWRF